MPLTQPQMYILHKIRRAGIRYETIAEHKNAAP